MASIVKEDISSKFPSNINIEDSSRHSSLVAQEEGPPLSSLGFTESHSHELPDEALMTAFSNVNLDMDASPRNSLQPPEESRNTKIVSHREAINGVTKASISLYNQIGGIGKIPPNMDSGMKTVPSTMGSDGLTTGKMYINDAMVFGYSNGLGPAPSNSSNGSRNASLYGVDDIEHCWVGSLANNANPMGENNNLRDLTMYSDYKSLDHDIGTRKHIHTPLVADMSQSSVYDAQFFPQQGRPSTAYLQSLHAGQPLYHHFFILKMHAKHH